jgi:RNA polymerase sigma-70 factor (ECF subfamily)
MLVSDPDTTTEAAILRAAMAGESDAFAELFRHYYPMIYAFAYRLSLDRTSAQDLAQETFIKAARALRDYQPSAPFHHWLYRICTNTVRAWQRREGRRRFMEDSAQARAKIDSAERPPEFDSAREALAVLPEELRAAVVLVYFEELNHAEAARVLGCAETTVSWRIFTAKRKLKALLTRHE